MPIRSLRLRPVVARPSYRFGPSLTLALVFVLALAGFAYPQSVINPRAVQFNASASHNVTLTGGASAVASYDIEVYLAGAPAPFHAQSIGKPAPDANGVIEYDFSAQSGAWPLPGGTYEMRVAAVGPTGTARSAPSNPFTFQPLATCAYTASPGALAPSSGGGTSSIAVTTASGCAWTASPGASWATLSSTSGTGSGSVTVTFAANTTGVARSTALTIAGQTVSVTQAAVQCTYSVSPTTRSFASGGGTASLTVTAAAGCSWTASSPASWVTLSPTSGVGTRTVTATVAANTAGTSRSATLTVAAVAATVSQSAAAYSYGLSPTSVTLTSVGGTSTTTLTTSSGCSWTAASNTSWATVSPTNGTGGRSITVTVQANADTTPRTATVSVAGRTFTVTQSAAACAYTVSPASVSLGYGASSATLSVSTTSGCSWTASSGASWTSASPASGSGSGTVTVSAAANATASQRTTAVTVAGTSVPVAQAAARCTFSLSPASISSAAAGGTSAVTLTVAAGCAWTAAGDAWLTPTPASGAGATTIQLAVAGNPAGSARSGSLIVAGRSVSVLQAAQACSFSLSPTAVSFGASGGREDVAMTTLPGCGWAASTDAPWLSVSVQAGTGSAEFATLAEPNISTSVRTATITAGGRTATVTQAPATEGDVDSDGLPDSWEAVVGLRPDLGTGADGAAGDPDGDGASNAEEHAAGTHPRGDDAYSRYFAEGATGPFFDTRLAIVNPDSSDAHVWVRFLKSDGTAVTTGLVVGGRSRATIDPEELQAIPSGAFATVLQSDREVVVDRTMTWDDTGYGSHTETGIVRPATSWYFAEGATHSGFDLFLLLQNPTSTDAEVLVRYLRPVGAALEKTYAVKANSRENVWVNHEVWPDGSLPLASAEVSAEVHVLNGVPIVAERAMYKSGANGRPFDAGHESAGTTSPALSWFLAEGATGNYFDLFVLAANTDPTRTAKVRFTYLLPDGSRLSRMRDVAPSSRSTTWVDYEVFEGVPGWPLFDTPVSTIVESTNGVPIVVERAMWWPGPTPDTWAEAHNSPGATQSGTVWASADGEVADAPKWTSTYMLVANVSQREGQGRVTLFYEGGGEEGQVLPLVAGGRTTIDVRALFPACVNRRFGVLVESLGSSPVQIVVERAVYSDALGVPWAAGSNSLARRLR